MSARPFIPALLALAISGCAFLNPANRPLLNALDEAVKPEATWAKIALGPVFVPTGVLCAVMDIAVAHPVQSVGFASAHTWRALWAQHRGPFAEQALLFVPKLAATPLVFTVVWLGDSVFDLRRRKGEKPR